MTPPPPIRVAIVAPTFGILGGHAVQAQQMLDGWRDDPAVIAWLVPINPTAIRPLRPLQKIKYVRTVITQISYWPALVRKLRSADVVHVFSASYYAFLLCTVPAVLVARLLGKPVVLNYHSGQAPDHLSRSRVARWVLARLVDSNVVPSAFLRDVFARFGLRTEVVFNSVDVERFRYRSRAPLGRHLLSTRNLEQLYNIPCTLRAFARVQARYPDAALTVIGGGSQKESILSLVDELGLQNVTLTGRIPPEDMPAYYDAADIYVQTPSIDNMPLSVLEAFSSGLPVVSTDVGGVNVILTDGEHGLLARDDDEEMVADRILDLLANPDRARQLAAAAHDSCRAYEWPNVRTGWLRVYQSAARATSRRTAVTAEAA